MSNEPPPTSPSGSSFCSTFSWAVFLWTTDLLAYGWLIPVLMTYVGGKATTWINLHLGTLGTTLIVMIAVFWTLSILFRGRQEAKFWRHYFSGENGFQSILKLRDAVNSLSLVYFIYKLLIVIQAIISDGEMKENNLHEGIVYVALRQLQNLYPFADETYIEEVLGICPCKISIFGESEEGIFSSLLTTISSAFWTVFGYTYESVPSFACQEAMRNKAIHGAEFLLVMAQLTAAVTKLIYFNSLYAYHRAMNIFIQMENDGEFGSYRASCSISDALDEHGAIFEPTNAAGNMAKNWGSADEKPKSPKDKAIYTASKTADTFKPVTKK